MSELDVTQQKILSVLIFSKTAILAAKKTYVSLSPEFLFAPINILCGSHPLLSSFKENWNVRQVSVKHSDMKFNKHSLRCSVLRNIVKPSDIFATVSNSHCKTVKRNTQP